MSDDEYTPTTDGGRVARYTALYEVFVDRGLFARGLTGADFEAILAAHDAEVARVLPSAEDVARAIDPACDDRPVDEANWPDVYRVLALIADAPSREQVEREAAEKAWDEAVAMCCQMLGARNVNWPNPHRADRLAAGGNRG